MTEVAVPEEPAGWGRLVVVSVILVVIVLALAFLLVPGLGISLGPQPSTGQSFTSTGARTSSAATNPGGTATTGAIIRVTVQALRGGGAETLEYTDVTPAVLSLTARADGVEPMTYAWSFGDGTNSSFATVLHTFPVNRAYDIHLRVTDATGAVESKDIILQAFSSQNSAISSVIYPAVGTAGISQVGIEGGYTPRGTLLQVFVDGSQVTSTRVNQQGYWSVDIGRFLTPKPNGSAYSISIVPINKTKTFVTVEGVSVSPSAGVPGTAVQVTGRSYPPFTTVTVYLGGVSLGQVKTDGFGSFDGNFTIPGTSPLVQEGAYQVTTSPPAVGAQATFVVPRTTSLLSPTGPGLILWVVGAVAAVAVVAFLLIRRRRRYYYYLPPPAPEEGVSQPPGGGEAPPPPPPEEEKPAEEKPAEEKPAEEPPEKAPDSPPEGP